MIGVTHHLVTFVFTSIISASLPFHSSNSCCRLEKTSHNPSPLLVLGPNIIWKNSPTLQHLFHLWGKVWNIVSGTVPLITNLKSMRLPHKSWECVEFIVPLDTQQSSWDTHKTTRHERYANTILYYSDSKTTLRTWKAWHYLIYNEV